MTVDDASADAENHTALFKDAAGNEAVGVLTGFPVSAPYLAQPTPQQFAD